LFGLRGGSHYGSNTLMPSDAELIRHYARGKSDEAFAELVQRHVNLVYRAALRQLGGDAHRAEDATQIVFTLLARKADSLIRHPSFAGWLYTTTHFTVRDMQRAERRRQHRELEAHAMQELHADSATAADWEQVRPVLDDAMQALSEKDRSAILARFFEGCSFAEVGARLALSEDAARMRVERAMEKLRVLLTRRGVTSAASALGVMLASEAAAAPPAGLATAVAGSALASAGIAGVTPSGWGIIQLMSTTKVVATAAGLAVLLAVVGVVRERRASHLAGEALAAASLERDAAAARAREWERQANEAERRLATLEATAAEQRSEPATAPVPGLVEPSDPIANGRNFLAHHPEAAAMVLEYCRTQFSRDYQLLFKELALSPHQIEQFMEIMVQANAGIRWNTSAQVPFAEIGIGPKPTAEERRERLRAVLGDVGYERFSDFQRTYQARFLAEEVVRSANASGAALTAPQARQLVETFARHSPDYRAGRGVQLSNFDWDAALRATGGILNVQQQRAVVAIRAQREFDEALRRAEGEAMAAAKRAAGIPPPF
jgi:RNA polymerase sigma factor (sigma-70 family)